MTWLKVVAALEFVLAGVAYSMGGLGVFAGAPSLMIAGVICGSVLTSLGFFFLLEDENNA